MDERIARRLDELRTELAEGQRALAELDTRRADLVSTMLRIDGAVTVLEELVAGSMRELDTVEEPAGPHEPVVDAVTG